VLFFSDNHTCFSSTSTLLLRSVFSPGQPFWTWPFHQFMRRNRQKNFLPTRKKVFSPERSVPNFPRRRASALGSGWGLELSTLDLFPPLNGPGPTYSPPPTENFRVPCLPNVAYFLITPLLYEGTLGPHRPRFFSFLDVFPCFFCCGVLVVFRDAKSLVRVSPPWSCLRGPSPVTFHLTTFLVQENKWEPPLSLSYPFLSGAGRLLPPPHRIPLEFC